MLKLLIRSLSVALGKIKASSLTISLPLAQILLAELYIHVSPFYFYYLPIQKLLLTYLHSDYVVNKVRSEFRNIFFEMGFTEMPTNR